MPEPTPTDLIKPKRTRGRPKGTTKPKPMHMVNVHLTIRPDQRKKLGLLGGSEFLRKMIDEAH